MSCTSFRPGDRIINLRSGAAVVLAALALGCDLGPPDEPAAGRNLEAVTLELDTTGEPGTGADTGAPEPTACEPFPEEEAWECDGQAVVGYCLDPAGDEVEVEAEALEMVGFMSEPTPSAKPEGPKCAYEPNHRGTWGHDAKKQLYGDKYSRCTLVVVGGVAYATLDRLPETGFTTSLSGAELDGLRDYCKNESSDWMKIRCAAANCERIEKMREGVCRHIASCTERVLDRLGFDADLRYFSMNLWGGHVVVDVKVGGTWYVLDPTWAPCGSWVL